MSDLATLVPPTDLAEPGPPLLDELSPAERLAVEAAVDDANALFARTGLELALGLHDLVIGRFFAGEFAAFSDRSRYKPRSFAAFLGHARLAAAAETVRFLVRVGEQARHLRNEVALGLTVGHHKVLLSLDDVAVRERLAEQAVREGWTIEALTDAVRAQAPEPPAPEPRATRPKTHDAVRAARQELVKGLSPQRLARDWARMTPRERRRTGARLVELIAHLQALHASLPPVEPPE